MQPGDELILRETNEAETYFHKQTMGNYLLSLSDKVTIYTQPSYWESHESWKALNTVYESSKYPGSKF